MNIVLDVARGYNSGFSTVANFRRTNGKEGQRAWLSTGWGGFKTAIKADKIATLLTKSPRVTNPIVWMVFSGWALAYGVSAYVCDKPNPLMRYSPHLILITRLALTALEFLVNSRKAAIGVVAMGLTELCYRGCFDPMTTQVLTKAIPIAAKITVFVFGDPLTQIITVAEFVAQLALSQSLS